MKYALPLILVLITCTNWSQSSLSKKLWNSIKLCHENMEDMDEDGAIDYDSIVDDAKNGYLYAAGSWPTCGCGCAATAGAYKDYDGNYTIIAKQHWDCGFDHMLSANRGLAEVLPDGFSFNDFAPAYKPHKGLTPRVYYLDIIIPRKGTDTKVELSAIPIGLNLEQPMPLVYEYSEEGANPMLKRIKEIVGKLNDFETINLLLEGKSESIKREEMAILLEYIGDDWNDYESLEVLTANIKTLHNIYEVKAKVEYDSILLGWDKKEGRFYIKEKYKAEHAQDFKTFILESNYWEALC